MSATLICSGSTPNDRAMLGRAVASTVPSSCSMNIAVAMISGTVRDRRAGGLAGMSVSAMSPRSPIERRLARP